MSDHVLQDYVRRTIKVTFEITVVTSGVHALQWLPDRGGWTLCGPTRETEFARIIPLHQACVQHVLPAPEVYRDQLAPSPGPGTPHDAGRSP